MTTGTISVMIFARPGCNGRREEAMRAYVRAFPICLVALATAALSAPAGAAETLRVGKAVPFAWTFTPVEVGIETGRTCLSAGMVQHHRLHEGQQGEDRRHHRQGAQPEPG